MTGFVQHGYRDESQVNATMNALRKVDATLNFYQDYALSEWHERVHLRLRGADSLGVRKSTR